MANSQSNTSNSSHSMPFVLAKMLIVGGSAYFAVQILLPFIVQAVNARITSVVK